jgi:hypothetical protein
MKQAKIKDFDAELCTNAKKATQPFARVCENSAASQCGAGFTLPRWQLGPPFQVAYPLTPLPVLAVSLLL